MRLSSKPLEQKCLQAVETFESRVKLARVHAVQHALAQVQLLPQYHAAYLETAQTKISSDSQTQPRQLNQLEVAQSSRLPFLNLAPTSIVVAKNNPAFSVLFGFWLELLTLEIASPKLITKEV